MLAPGLKCPHSLLEIGVPFDSHAADRARDMVQNAVDDVRRDVQPSHASSRRVTEIVEHLYSPTPAPVASSQAPASSSRTSSSIRASSRSLALLMPETGVPPVVV